MAATMSLKLFLVALATIHGVAAVSIPPKIIEQSPVDIYYKVGESVKLTCRASGIPAPKYSWKRADEVFSPEGNEDRVVQMRDVGTIIINRPEDKDEGFYQCFAENSFGVAATIKFNLRQAKLKGFNIAQPQTYTPQLGSSLKLKCPSPDSVPDAEIYWAVGSRVIQRTARHSMDYDDSLHFTYVNKEDDGKCFHCVAVNTFMRKSVKGPQHCIKTEGKSLAMSPMSLAWPDSQFDGRGRIGETLRLKCIFSGYPTPNVYWSKKGSKNLNPRVKTGGSGGQELTITDLRYEDEGTYVCRASKTQADRQMEMSIAVAVESLPEWVNKPKDVTLGVGSSAEFLCEGKGIPEVKVYWFINGDTLEEALKKDKRLSKERFHSSKNKLVLLNVGLTDTMVVQCNVTNINGFLWGEAFLNVLNEKPAILERPEDTKVAEGQNFRLPCRITGRPMPIVTWFKDGTQITGGHYSILESGSLAVTATVLADAGNYVCHAKNEYGEVEARAYVIVRRKTVIEMAPLDLEVQTGTNAKFTCSGTTDPQEISSLTTTWVKDGTEIEIGTRMFINYQDNSLTISGTEQRDSGRYECVVSNGLDKDTKAARLVVTDLPLKNTRVKVKNNCAADMKAEVSWMPGAFNNAPIQYYTIEYQTTTYPNHWVFAEQVSYTKVKTFVPLAAGLKYSFRVTSYNKIGPSPPSEPSTTKCETRPTAPTQNPRNVRTIGEIPHKLHIEWTPVPPEHQGGPGFQYILNILRIGDAENTILPISIKDWTEHKYILTATGETYAAYQIGISSTNNIGNSTDSTSKAIIGYSGEGMPEISPYNLQVVEPEPQYVTLEWEFDSNEIGKENTRIKGEFRGFKIQIWEMNKRYESITNIDLPPKHFDITPTNSKFRARVRHMKPNSVLEARVAVLNNFYVSAPSEVISFESLPGLPGPVSYLEDLNVGDQHINLQWWPSLDNRKGVIGYAIGYQEVEGLRLGNLQERIPQIDDPYATTAVLGGLKPNTKYRIFVWARTSAGRSEPYFIERTTAKPGVPMIPRFTVANVGRDSINLTWWKDAYQDSGNVVLVEFMKRDGLEWISTNPEISRSWTTLHFLEPGIEYSVRIVVTNGASVRRMSETQHVRTRGGAKAYDVTENFGWFLATIFALLFQIGLIVLFIICYRKGFRFEAIESHVQTYTDKGQTYSDESSFPRTSFAFQDQPGFANDYYKGSNEDGFDYDDQDDYKGEDHRYDNEDDYEDRDEYSDEEYRADKSEQVEDDYRGERRRHYDDYGSRPYNDVAPERSRRYPEEREFGDNDMDSSDGGRRYPPDRSRNTSYDAAREETRETGYRTESYRTERSRDVKREEPRHYQGGRAGSERVVYETRDKEEPNQYMDELRDRLRHENRAQADDRDRSDYTTRSNRSSTDTQDYSGTLI